VPRIGDLDAVGEQPCEIVPGIEYAVVRGRMVPSEVEVAITAFDDRANDLVGRGNDGRGAP
jgi:hypothetical protein